MPCSAKNTGDPNAKNGMMTKVWGPAGWLFLHCVTFGYPQDPDQYDVDNGLPVGETRRHYYNFFREVGFILPCKYCRDSYRDFAKEVPLANSIKNRETLTKWLHTIHNRVNNKLGMHYCDAEFNKITDRYESYRAKCKALSSEERTVNENKGCVTPADGTPKKCLIDIVQTNKGDITRRNPKTGQEAITIGATLHQNCPRPVATPWTTMEYLIIIILLAAAVVIGYWWGRNSSTPRIPQLPTMLR
jgi:hypothetical protein